jgi:hypothetical protein
MGGSHRWARMRRVLAGAVAPMVVVGVALVAPSGAVQAPEGAGPPVPGSGIGTKAALNNPRCVTDDEYGVYGRFNSQVVGGGPICVKPWKAGADNGGATARGVTEDAVTVVAIVPNAQQNAADVAQAQAFPTNRATNQPASYADGINDVLQPLMEFYETWGRDIRIELVESSGDDEEAQRADAVTIKAMDPFAVIDMSPRGFETLNQELAKAKIMVSGVTASTPKALAQAPYRWGTQDSQAAVVGAAELVGKQLVGKKAEFGGDDVAGEERVFGAVYQQDAIELEPFEERLADFDGTLAVSLPYEGTGSAQGDPQAAAAAVPPMVQKLKEQGVTSIVLFADGAMNQALMERAQSQSYFPEWIYSGALFADFASFARANPPEQMEHAFGLSTIPPYVAPGANQPVNVLDWYWGTGAGTTSASAQVRLGWLLNGIHTAGPKLTTKTFTQGLFSSPGTGGAAQDRKTSLASNAYGKNAGLPYDEYMSTGFDYAPIWWDGTAVAPTPATGTTGTGNWWYPNGGQRYFPAQYPKSFPWFDKAGAITNFTTFPDPPTVPAPACTSCPAATGQSAGATDDSVVIGKAGGTSAAS